jgi:hypothetical protein
VTWVGFGLPIGMPSSWWAWARVTAAVMGAGNSNQRGDLVRRTTANRGGAVRVAARLSLPGTTLTRCDGPAGPLPDASCYDGRVTSPGSMTIQCDGPHPPPHLSTCW